ncbi:hypothetical protein GCM10029964_044710 [Kibdelosporangium lantanae]
MQPGFDGGQHVRVAGAAQQDQLGGEHADAGDPGEAFQGLVDGHRGQVPGVEVAGKGGFGHGS